MAELHDALKYLAPVEWKDVPQDDLSQYLTDCFTAGELICNSVPPNPDGTAFESSKPHLSEPNQATSHKDMHPSTARAPAPHKDHEDLQRHWGKPMKLKNNLLHVSVYKMAGHDRHGAWFARRSVHEGLGFDKFKRAMMREFPESMKVVGGPGAGAVRGLTADRRLEREEVQDVGKLEVYELSAQFPGPTTPRDFVPMLLSSDDALSSKSAANSAGHKNHIPRHMMLVSRPVQHPDAPERSGYVRGQYESVEMIREIPLTTVKAASTTNLLSSAATSSTGRDRGQTADSSKSSESSTKQEHTDASELQHDPELNPVEWIMITRSDPGGGLPRFLVERGTPDTMLEDVHKFFNWACSQDAIPHPDEDLDEQQDASAQKAEGHEVDENEPPPAASNATSPPEADANQQGGGLINNVTHALEAGIEAYAPVSISQMVHQRLHPTQEDADLSDDYSDSSSSHTFLSADELQKVETAPEHPRTTSTDNLSVMSGVSDMSKHSRHLSRHEKDMLKLSEKRERLDQQLAKKRIAEEQKLRQAQEKDEAEAARQKEKIEKDLKKMEEKHRQEVEKVEQRREREARKAEEKRRKKDDHNKLSLVTRERDDFRSQLDLYKQENRLLRQQVEALQVQNTTMASRLGKLGEGDALKEIQGTFNRSRTSSMKSRESANSTAKSLEK